MSNELDVVVVGYNEIPFENYLDSVKIYGENSPGFRDLRPNYFEIEGVPQTYVDVLNAHSGGSFLSCDIPNLAAVYLCNFLIRRKLQAEYINLFQQERERLKTLIARRPLAVAITTTFYISSAPVVEMIQFIKDCDPNIPIIVGGVLVSNIFNVHGGEDFRFVLQQMGADIYVLESQGELTLYNLIQTLKTKGRLSEVANLIYFDREMDAMVSTDRKLENNALDEEDIDWGLFKDYSLGETLQTRTARSCAFSCAFCGYPERGGPLTSAKIETVARELETMRGLGGVRNVVFIDDTFNVPKGRFRELCQMLIDRNFGFNWYSYYRCDHGDEETIRLMAKSGCKGVFLGIESGSQRMLEAMNKRAKVASYERGLRCLKENGILTFASFIIGFPGETEESIQETIDFIRVQKPDYWRTMLWYCDPLTPVYKNNKEQLGIKGEGFGWSHYTMDAVEAAQRMNALFLQINPDESIWMPQYSFDFWIIPYLLGKGLSQSDFKRFMHLANQAMTFEISAVSTGQKELLQKGIFEDMDRLFSGCRMEGVSGKLR